jgi:transcription antitermination factor NusG
MGEARLSESAPLAALLPHFDSTAMQSQSCDWYALKVRTGGELSTVTALRMRGFDPFCPTQQERRRYSDRMKVVETAVFPGYVFCKFDIQKKLPVVSAPGVEYIVGFAGIATPIPEVHIQHIRRMVKAGAGACVSDRFTQGQRVRVTHGPLEGVEGILVRDPRGDRLVVSIDLLHQSASLHIDQYQTKPV